MSAFVLRMSGLRQIAERCWDVLGTDNFSSLSSAMRRVCSLNYVRELIRAIEPRHQPQRDDLVAIDGMAVTVRKTLSPECKKFNSSTVGGGVVWSYQIDARKGSSPVRLLAVIQGAWHDTRIMRGVELIAQGPVYVMDRGFYAFDLLTQWMNDHVRFIVRARRHGLIYEVARTISRPRRHGTLKIVEDVMARLGGEQAKAHPQVRLITALLASGEKLSLVTGEMDWSAERVLDAYKKRWHIERFHKFLKQTLGLAHLYSFGQNGIEFLTLTALLLAMVLLESATAVAVTVIDTLHKILRQVRRFCGLSTPWKSNTVTRTRSKRKSKNY